MKFCLPAGLLTTAILGCANHSSVTPTVTDDRRGYSVNPGDFWGINFKAGEPSSNGSLLSALSSPRDREALKNDLAVLKKMPSNVTLRVLGFTDSKECSDVECMKLSLRRASSLHDWLIEQGIPKSRLDVPHGLGSARAIGDNETEDGRARNRRAYISYEAAP
ncbi:OmpA family protein [Luteimonas panaciterrae]|uniref:OmpA family protein n=1 Tax=Luteimonas panaciterrae TaxID=363885 RepID=UPI001CF9E3CC